MKLELNHLCPYLPYDIKWKAQNNRICVLNGKNISFAINPILRPMSDIYNLVESKRFMVYEPIVGRLGIPYKTKAPADLYHYIKHGNLASNKERMLFQLHFDVFGLIDKGLAIDINKLTAAQG